MIAIRTIAYISRLNIQSKIKKEDMRAA